MGTNRHLFDPASLVPTRLIVLPNMLSSQTDDHGRAWSGQFPDASEVPDGVDVWKLTVAYKTPSVHCERFGHVTLFM
jgi:hypothetical protein